MDASRLPLVLADLHRSLPAGAPIHVRLPRGDSDHPTGADLMTGAGFGHLVVTEVGDQHAVDAVRLRSLPDIVATGMQLLVCGLNPSLHAADAGVGYAGPANRFWPVIAEVVGLADSSPALLLTDHGIGMTDLVKRATTKASEISAAEFRTGLARVDRLSGWLRPAAVCFVGLGGWRAAGHPRAQPGWQLELVGGRPVYVMPSTSGRNAHASRGALSEHLRRALRTRS